MPPWCLFGSSHEIITPTTSDQKLFSIKILYSEYLYYVPIINIIIIILSLFVVSISFYIPMFNLILCPAFLPGKAPWDVCKALYKYGFIIIINT